jgi:hypothetical protein
MKKKLSRPSNDTNGRDTDYGMCGPKSLYVKEMTKCIQLMFKLKFFFLVSYAKQQQKQCLDIRAANF